MRFVRTLVVLAAIALSAGCGEDEPRNLREWTAEDHLQPQQPQEGRAAPPGGGEPVEASQEQIREAAEALFIATCGGCHGRQGAGDGPSAPTAEMPDLSSAEWQQSKSDADIARSIRMGQGLMPAYGGQLNARGIAALVAHVRTLGPGGVPAGDAPEGDAPEGDAPEGDAPEGDASQGGAPVAPSPAAPSPAAPSPAAPSPAAPSPAAPSPAAPSPAAPAPEGAPEE